MNILKRTRWYLRNLDETAAYSNSKAPIPEPDINKANLIGSLLPNGEHGPCIDLDFPCRLFPSRTQGHFHLYLERELSWEDYEKLLLVMHKIGLVQYGFYKSAVDRKQTFLRPPGVFQPSCTTTVSDNSEVLALIDLVRAAVGTGPPRDELDRKITALEDRVYSMMAAKIDEIVARRVQRGMAVPSEELSQRSNGGDDPPRRIDVHRVRPLRRKAGS
jgi:hypothetical protein